jgi:beta-glucosidase
MKSLKGNTTAIIVAFCIAVSLAYAQDTQKPAYLDTSLPAEQRAADLVHRMTLEEKASQLVNQAPAIPRLQVTAYNWWSESLHGVAVNGTTEFPEPIGLGATFDTAAIHEMAIAIGTEGRIKHAQAERAGHSNIMEGLDFWSPNINIFRDPRWGRGQETYGEDPFLTGRMAVAFVTGMQGDDPRYYRVISTPKHFAVHSGPEPERHRIDVVTSKHDELDTYLPAFRAAVIEGKAGSVMCAYNRVNGEPACASEFLLVDQLRQKWGFQGYVVSDCDAVTDIYRGHNFTPAQPEASALSLQRGMDNECADFGFLRTDDKDYRPFLDAVQQGLLKESEIDTALTRLFTARMKLGMFDPPETAPYAKIDEKELDSAEHRALARKLANESMVLLKNDGTLPLKSSGIKIAVIGPLANQTRVLLGNYNGTPSHTVSILEGIKKEFAGASITYVEGTDFLSNRAEPVPAGVLTVEGKPGVKVSYSEGRNVSFSASAPPPPALIARVEPTIDAGKSLPPEVRGKRPLSIRWEATLIPPDTGEYNLGMRANGFFRLMLDGKSVALGWRPNGLETAVARIHLDKGKSYALQATYSQPEDGEVAAQLMWSKLDQGPHPEAIAAAKEADAIVAVVGITSQLEGEEMEVNVPGFKGGDRTSLDLPQPEEDLLEALAATGKPLVVVLTSGSALSVNWASRHANAILEAWYPGEEGGKAVAETLSGRNNPAGRLPVTFYTGVDQLLPFENYFMRNRTYRYFTGKPLYPFGYGLSYTTFSYSGLSLPSGAVKAGDPVTAEVTVTNTGQRAGDEVAQLYLSFPAVKGAPLRALRAFRRVHLEPGASQKVRFELKPRDLSMVTEAGEPIIAEGKYSLSIGGGQPDTGAPVTAGTFAVKGSVVLPE